MEREEGSRGRETGKERGGQPGSCRRRGQGKGVGSVVGRTIEVDGFVEQRMVILGIMVLM